MIGRRANGILLHISSLYSEYGIGDIGKPACNFIDFLKQSGQKFWQILPINPTSLSKGNSPYASFSAFAGNPLFISQEILYEEGFLSKSDLNSSKLPYSSSTENKINYRKVTALKKRMLDTAFKNFHVSNIKNSFKYTDDFNNFCRVNEEIWLEDFAFFIALKNYFKRKYKIVSWKYWPDTVKNRNEKALRMLKNKLDKAIRREKFIQYIFYRQWASLKNYADRQGIKIIGDIPIYVDYESADVWSNQKLFKLGNDKNPSFIAGVPPDYFSKTGQLWNNPVYNWKIIKGKNFSWWLERLKHNLTIFGVVRIDHFRGFIAYWEVPYGEKTAEKGRWVNSYGEELFYKLLKDIKNPSIIAENLGVITPDVEEVIKKFNFYGIKVLQFAFGKDFPSSDHLPINHSKNIVVYTGTHDNNTVKGWYEKEATPLEKKNLELYTGKKITASNVSQEFINLAVSSAANLAIIPIQDILGLDSRARMNRPSKIRDNWRWQMSKNMINESLSVKLLRITKKYDRVF